MFFLKKRNKRKHRRKIVNWDGELEVKFPGFETRLKVAVENISMAGVCFHCQEISIEGHHLVITDHPPVLSLTLPCKQDPMVVPVEISWYRRSTSKNRFIVGVAFRHLSKDQKSNLKNFLKDPDPL